MVGAFRAYICHFMQVHRSIHHLPKFRNSVVTIGTFDGVHLGHQQIIKQLKEEAEKIDGETIIITFHPHPRSVVKTGTPVYLLNTLEEKISLLSSFGIDHLIVVPFDKAFSEQTPEEYVVNFLFEKCRPHTLIIGYDHHFGKNRAGDYHLLERFGKELGFTVKEIPEQLINDITISSTRIREALLTGEIETANSYLGYNYFFEGMVVDGNKLGRTLGYPTANIIIHDEDKLVPANGIYVAEAEIAGFEPAAHSSQLLQGMMSIGIRPTVNGKDRTIEMNIFDFNEDIYGRIIKIFVCKYLRIEEKFNTLEELVRQIDIDKQNSLQYFENVKNK
ncbi:bifunctional riboflavin kinase/FAD synthetase [Parafilimonas terrae]|uniref:Riboflavin biosynthesis protein n=1 Tax=Parafilimonas terrae TaxID=1465490 RepID=A0A1I5WWJ7_9BACT|nr:bifunctional riboflavin kinase/FAD synthetase [Parafilimonas terrae]SFQ23991.1 riboflavin kinase / FMN adenylyltransferase [Parafilimonas terrae]